MVDGGSTDATCAEAKRAGARLLRSPRGRGPQLNAGWRAATGDDLLFLHADTRLPPGYRRLLREAWPPPGALPAGPHSGRGKAQGQPRPLALWGAFNSITATEVGGGQRTRSLAPCPCSPPPGALACECTPGREVT